MTFEEKVRSMTAKEIIMAMVESLIPPPAIKIDMGTYGSVMNDSETNKPTCFGCAATNTICKIAGKVFTEENIHEQYRRAEFVDCDRNFLDYFESAIDALRRGKTRDYNSYAFYIEIAEIEGHGIVLPHLRNDYTKEDLEPYIKLANLQKVLA